MDQTLSIAPFAAAAPSLRGLSMQAGNGVAGNRRRSSLLASGRKGTIEHAGVGMLEA